MDLRRTPLLLETAMLRKTAYPAGWGKSKEDVGIDDEYPDTPEGRKLAKAHAWQFPSKRIKVGKTILRY